MPVGRTVHINAPSSATRRPANNLLLSTTASIVRLALFIAVVCCVAVCDVARAEIVPVVEAGVDESAVIELVAAAQDDDNGLNETVPKGTLVLLGQIRVGGLSV